MKSASPIEITLKNSVVHGDVVGGDKVVAHVHIHADKLTSEAVLLAELARHGLEATKIDELIAQLLQNEPLRQKFDAARSTCQTKLVDERVAVALAEYERTGPNPQTIASLESLTSETRKLGDHVAYAKVAVLLLQFYGFASDYTDRRLRLSDELVDFLRDHAEIQRYTALVLAGQARYMFFKYTDAILNLRTTLAARAALPAKVPLAGLVAEQKDILGNWHLADAYMHKAMEIALAAGDSSLMIAVLFEAEALQEHAHFFHRHLLRRDGSEQSERVFHLLKLLEEMTAKYGDEKDRILVRYNAAHFFLQIEDFDKAAQLAMDALGQLTRIGQSYYATKALDIFQAAQRKEPPVPPPAATSLEALSGAEYEALVRDISSRLLKLGGYDLDHDDYIKRAVEGAWQDLNPERVMRFCEHLALSGDTSPLGEKIGLPTLGMKSVRCAKYGGEIQGASLDDAFEFFRQSLCNQCKDRMPRPENWKWRPADPSSKKTPK